MTNEPERDNRRYKPRPANTAKFPDECETMADVRKGVDTVDREIMALLGTRFGYMSAAARIKPTRGAVRDEERKAQVIENAKKEAWKQNVPVGFVGEFWDRLVEASIAFEFEQWDQTRKDD